MRAAYRYEYVIAVDIDELLMSKDSKEILPDLFNRIRESVY